MEHQWEVSKGGVYSPCGKTVPKIPSGMYTIGRNGMGGIYLQAKKFNTDDLLRFEDPTHQEIIGEVDHFWSLKEKYRNMGFLHNRSILMWGPPGSGKSCISKIVVGDVLDRGNIVVNCNNMYTLSEGLNKIRQVEPNRQIMVLAEDLDSIEGEHKVLSVLDGEDTVDNIFYLFTTNYIDRIPDRVLRPGRIDRRISVPHPPRTGRVAFLEHKIQDRSVAEELADATDGLSFAHLRELLVGIYCLGHKPEAVIERLRNIGAEELSNKEKVKDGRVEHTLSSMSIDRFNKISASITKASKLYKQSPKEDRMARIRVSGSTVGYTGRKPVRYAKIPASVAEVLDLEVVQGGRKRIHWEYRKGDRIVVKFPDGAYMGTVTVLKQGKIYVAFDDGDSMGFPARSTLILGPGVTRKKAGPIPMNEADKWIRKIPAKYKEAKQAEYRELKKARQAARYYDY